MTSTCCLSDDFWHDAMWSVVRFVKLSKLIVKLWHSYSYTKHTSCVILFVLGRKFAGNCLLAEPWRHFWAMISDDDFSPHGSTFLFNSLRVAGNDKGGYGLGVLVPLLGSISHHLLRNRMNRTAAALRGMALRFNYSFSRSARFVVYSEVLSLYLALLS